MKVDRFRRAVVAGLLVLGLDITATAQTRVEANVVYGIFDGFSRSAR